MTRLWGIWRTAARLFCSRAFVLAFVLGANLLAGAVAEPAGLSGPDYTGPSAGADECDPEMVGFELVTGYVFTAPTNMLESIPGSLMLTDCLETCQANDSCQAVNYETGLCVLFSSNADSNPGKCVAYSNGD